MDIIAALAYASMIGVFFAMNDPVNRAVNGWTLATLPSNWPDYRLRWEAGHALAAVLAILGFVATVLPSRDGLRSRHTQPET